MVSPVVFFLQGPLLVQILTPCIIEAEISEVATVSLLPTIYVKKEHGKINPLKAFETGAKLNLNSLSFINNFVVVYVTLVETKKYLKYSVIKIRSSHLQVRSSHLRCSIKKKTS